MPSPLDALRKLLLSINAHAQARATQRDARRLAVITARAGERLGGHINDIAALAARHEGETTAWVGPEALATGQGGRFDACDLRHWLALSERAGVPVVPARVILELSEDEMAVASGTVEMPDGPLLRRATGALAAALRRKPAPGAAAGQTGAPPSAGPAGPVADARAGGAAGAEGAAPANPDAEMVLDEEVAAGLARLFPVKEVPDRDSVMEKLAAAMDAVPEGWMVRHVRGGPSTLKTLAGCGASAPRSPDVRFGPELEVGPGWVRTGNRRRVDAADRRFVECYAHGPDGVPSVFVARPWVPAARWAVGEDPHRHGSQFAGKGAWPAEWRALVENGRVVGVASYYGWCGSATPENARIATRVRELAQRIVDEAVRQKAVPVYMPVEFARANPNAPAWLDERFPADGVNCTLDFIEVLDQGLTLLEGGPAFHYLLGGGHPCAFAGVERPDGVAFRTMPGISLGDPKTWKDTDRTGCILPWSAVEALALQDGAAAKNS